MRSRADLHDYQVQAIDHIKSNDQSMLWLDIGLGKTISTLTALSDMFASGKVYGVLVLGSLRICQTVWEQEAQRWSHTKHLTFSLVHGNPNHRKRAVRKRRMVYLLNYEGLPNAEIELTNAYLAKGRPLPFNCVVMDESTQTKSARKKQGGRRTEALQSLLRWIPYRVSLTGTPAPNGYVDLFGQYLVLDNGYRLGTSYEHYINSYFRQESGGYKYRPTKQGKNIIETRISDITLQVTNDKLPPMIINNIEVFMPPREQKMYDELEKEMFLQLDNGVKLSAPNAAALINKLLQIANGAVYHTPGDPSWEHIHDAKLDAVESILEELAGNPLLLGYQFKHDAERISQLAEKKGIEHYIVNSKIKLREMRIIENRFNAGQIPLLIGHGKSIGHGLNLQGAAHNICWFGLPWSSELYIQLNGRLARQGQNHRVTLHQLLTHNTWDYATLEAQKFKEQTQTNLKQAVNVYRRIKSETPVS